MTPAQRTAMEKAMERAALALELVANRMESIKETSPGYHVAEDIELYRRNAAILRAELEQFNERVKAGNA